jgi:hypothetical protein
VAERASQIAPPSMPEPITLSGASYSPPAPTGRKLGRVRKRRRPWWVTALIVFGAISVFNWVRHSDDPTPSRLRPPGVEEPRASKGDRIGAAVEDAVADLLNNVGSDSPAIQLARAKIFWERARKNNDAALMQKAEETFNQVLRLDPDSDDEAEAREALRQIAASKEPTAGP